MNSVLYYCSLVKYKYNKTYSHDWPHYEINIKLAENISWITRQDIFLSVSNVLIWKVSTVEGKKEETVKFSW